MEIEPYDWSVVVAGYWNAAILTPRGIAKRLFELTEGTPILVEVPIDGLAPHRVRHDGIVVAAESERLALTLETPTLANLGRAKQIAARAARALPETPLTAAGFNIRLKLADPPQRLLQDTAAAIDASLSDAGQMIKSRSTKRSLEYGKGLLNLDICHEGDGETKIELNFHRKSGDAAELCDWLETPDASIREILTTVLDRVLGLPFKEEWQ
jgi:hypothetical protein